MENSLSSQSQNPNVRLTFEVGHKCEDVHTTASPAGSRIVTCDWRLWVKSASGHNISSLVEKIVFKIRPEKSIASTIKAITEPPYYIHGSNSCNFVNVHICMFIKVGENNIKKIKIKYYMDIKNRKKRPLNKTHMHYEFVDPPDELKENLLKCGGVVCGMSVAPLTMMMDMMEV